MLPLFIVTTSEGICFYFGNFFENVAMVMEHSSTLNTEKKDKKSTLASVDKESRLVTRIKYI